MEDEYLYDEVASDSEDEKSIRAAENRAVKKMKYTRKKLESKTEKDQRRQQDHLHKLRMTVGMELITMPRSPFQQRKPVRRLQRIPSKGPVLQMRGLWTLEPRVQKDIQRQ